VVGTDTTASTWAQVVEEIGEEEAKAAYGSKEDYEKGIPKTGTAAVSTTPEVKVTIISRGNNKWDIVIGSTVTQVTGNKEEVELIAGQMKVSQLAFFGGIPVEVRKAAGITNPGDFTVVNGVANIGDDTTLKKNGVNWEITKTETKTENGIQTETETKKLVTSNNELIENVITTIVSEQERDEEGKPIENSDFKLISKTEVVFDQNANTRTETIFEVDAEGKLTDNFESITINSFSGEPVRLKNQDGEVSIDENGEVEGDNPELISKLETLRTQYSSRRFFQIAESALTQFRGIGYLPSLFIDDEFLDEWRENVDQAFAELYLGTEYWTSAICSTEIEREAEGVAYVDTKLGLAAVAAHIEASRSDEIISPDGREFLYKITFNVKNGDYDEDPKALEKMKFNIELRGERTVNLFIEDIEVEKGDQFGRIKTDAIVQFSNFFYDQICITFDDVPSFWTIDDDLCNTIVGSSGPTSITDTSDSTSGDTQTGEGNINDI